MITSDDVAQQLRSADTAWTTVRGLMRHHRRHDLVTIGFEWFFADLESHGWRVGPAPEGAVAAAVAQPHEIEAVLAVAARRPGRRRVEALSRRGGEEWLADLVVVDGDTWWARTTDGVITNDGDPLHRNGGTEELALLTPGQVPLGYELTPTGDEEVVAGRPCRLVLATAGPPRVGPRVPRSEVFAHALTPPAAELVRIRMEEHW